MTTGPQATRLLKVWTRAPGAGGAGRPNVATAIHAALPAGEDLVLRPVLSLPKAVAVVRLAAAFLGALARRRPLPLQALLFAATGDGGPGSPPTVAYLDGVRACLQLERLAAQRPRPWLVVDLDDLMSRRAAVQRRTAQRLHIGYLEGSVPSIARRLLTTSIVSSLLLRYEHRTLVRLERRVVSLADRVVLVGQADGRCLQRRLPPALAPRVAVVPPPAAIVRSGYHGPSPERPARFVFVGTDALPQNATALSALIELWRRARPAQPLHWYGRRTRFADLPASVVAHGFVDDIAEAYAPGSVLVFPAVLAGGVKTKLLESLAHGCPVAASPAALEGLGWPEYPLRLSGVEQWLRFLRAPEDHLPAMTGAVAIGQRRLEAEHSPTRFAATWRALMGCRA